MAEHTPGPWEVSTFASHTEKAGLPAGVYTVEEDGTDGEYVCHIETDWIEPEEAHANARLIAAAPELLEACELGIAFVAAFMGHYKAAHGLKDYHPHHVRAINQMMAAVQKATGKEQRFFAESPD